MSSTMVVQRRKISSGSSWSGKGTDLTSVCPNCVANYGISQQNVRVIRIKTIGKELIVTYNPNGGLSDRYEERKSIRATPSRRRTTSRFTHIGAFRSTRTRSRSMRTAALSLRRLGLLRMSRHTGLFRRRLGAATRSSNGGRLRSLGLS